MAPTWAVPGLLMLVSESGFRGYKKEFQGLPTALLFGRGIVFNTMERENDLPMLTLTEFSRLS